MDIKKIIENLGEQYNGKYVILEEGMEFRGVPPMSSPEVSLTYNARLEALLSDDDKGAFYRGYVQMFFRFYGLC